VCIKKLESRGTETISLQRNDDIPTEVNALIATTMQSVSGAEWRGVQALDQNDTTELFGGDLVVCGDQLLCPTAILAVGLALGA
jgi:hypothetical protein